MSKCECCKEENSDLITYKGYKMCPTCYMGYVRKVKVCENNAKYETEIDQLKQQLKEYKNKENTFAVNSWDEMLKNCENCGLNECIGCEYTQTCVQNIKQQLAKKDKEIEKLNKTLEMCKHIERYDIGEMFLENAKLIIEKRQLAIQELEKVKEKIDCEMAIRECDINEQTADVCVSIAEQIDQQIKELKGEKDDI